MPENCYCRWLHLSDLHLIAASATDSAYRQHILYGSEGQAADVSNQKSIDAGGLRWCIHKNPVNCIVITGDFFSKGELSTDAKSSLKSFINTIYDICKAEGGWSTPEDNNSMMPRLFYCPGNHDLSREAIIEKEGKCIHRSNKILDIANKEQFPINDNQQKDLMEKSFQSFYAFMGDLIGKQSENFEAQVFTIPSTNSPCVKFISVNTALSAGQAKSEDDIDSEIETRFNNFLKAHHSQETKKALQYYKAYHEAIQIKNKKEIEDEKKLCFISKTSQERIIASLSNGVKYIPIVIGHHPTEFFCNGGQTTFSSFMHTIGSHIYLHGHTHIPRISNVPENQRTHMENKDRWCVGVGGLYLSDTDAYNQLSFSVGTITKDGQEYNCEIDMFIYTNANHINQRWTQYATPHSILLNPALLPIPKNKTSTKETKVDNLKDSSNNRDVDDNTISPNEEDEDFFRRWRERKPS